MGQGSVHSLDTWKVDGTGQCSLGQGSVHNLDTWKVDGSGQCSQS